MCQATKYAGLLRALKNVSPPSPVVFLLILILSLTFQTLVSQSETLSNKNGLNLSIHNDEVLFLSGAGGGGHNFLTEH